MTLAQQIFYPDYFGGAWGFCPDPVDFHAFQSIDVYDGHRLRCGNRIAGPALIETVTTTVLISRSFDCIVDRYRSFVLCRKDRRDLVRSVRQPQGEEVAA
jgi:N-methylhydantoinase A